MNASNCSGISLATSGYRQPSTKARTRPTNRTELIYLYKYQTRRRGGRPRLDRKEWVELAERRVQRVLRQRLYASRRQLEAKISEAGPLNRRPEPVILSEAIHNLLSSGRLAQEKVANTPFFYRSDHFDHTNPAHMARRTEVLDLWSRFLSCSGNTTLCGAVLEDLVWEAIDQSSDLYTPVDSRKQPLLAFGSVVLPGALDFSLALWAPDGTSAFILGEDKNIREWIYRSSVELWQLIGKAARLARGPSRVLPVLITRKIGYSTFDFLSKAGILGFQTHRQVFHPSVESDLARIRHKDGLGFHDVTTDLVLPPGLLSLFQKTIPAQATAYA